MLKLLLNHWQEHRKKPSRILTDDPLYSTSTSEGSRNAKKFYSVSRINPIYEDSEGSELAARKSTDNENKNSAKESNSDKSPKVAERKSKSSRLPSPKLLKDIIETPPHFLNRKLSLPFPEELQKDSSFLEVSSSEFTSFDTKNSLKENNKDSMQENEPDFSHTKISEHLSTSSETEIKNELLNKSETVHSNSSKKKEEDLPDDEQDLSRSATVKKYLNETENSFIHGLNSDHENMQSLCNEKFSIKKNSNKELLKADQTSPSLANVYTENVDKQHEEEKVMSFINAYFEKIKEPQCSKVSDNANEKSINNSQKTKLVDDLEGVSSEVTSSEELVRLDKSNISASGKSKTSRKESEKIESIHNNKGFGGILKNNFNSSTGYKKTDVIHRYKKSTNKINLIGNKKFNANVKTQLDTQKHQLIPSRSDSHQKYFTEEKLGTRFLLNKEQLGELNDEAQNNRKITPTSDCLVSCPTCGFQNQPDPPQSVRQSSSDFSGITRGDQVSTDSFDPGVHSESLFYGDEKHTRLDSSQDEDNFSPPNRHTLTAKLCNNCKLHRHSEKFNKTYEDYYKSVQDSMTRMHPDDSEGFTDCQSESSNSFCRHCHRERRLSLQQVHRHKILKSPLKDKTFSHTRGFHHLETRHSPEGSALDFGQEKLSSSNIIEESASFQQLPYNTSSKIPCTCQRCTLNNRLLTQSLMDISRESLQNHLWDPVESLCTCSFDMDHRRRVKFTEDSPHTHYNFTNSDINVVRLGTHVNDESTTDPIKHPYYKKNDCKSKELNENYTGNTKLQGSSSPTESVEDLIESYPWRVGRWEIFYHKENLRIRRKRAVFMGIMAIIIIIVIGITVAVVLACLRRKHSKVV
ncbi:uncharacterized protein LOC143256782 [Tachypleus tridentatus]|uniref:uncharacterized protein LOC143256782 n=1 Tax=Tachypleus tridentatus TaxID=6853 RepID=UPI003FD38029